MVAKEAQVEKIPEAINLLRLMPYKPAEDALNALASNAIKRLQSLGESKTLKEEASMALKDALARAEQLAEAKAAAQNLALLAHSLNSMGIFGRMGEDRSQEHHSASNPMEPGRDR